jgi:predicted ATPase/DNA-binding CsgD family transcriptional regulator
MDKYGSDHSSTNIEIALTDRELEVLRLIDTGLSNQEIADRLTLSYNTITWYVRQIFNKLGVDRRGQAVSVARAQGILSENQEVETQGCADMLTGREMDVLQMVGAGLSNQAIADQLKISYNTVTGYVKQIFKKLGVTRRTQAVATARSLGLLDNAQTEASRFRRRHNLPIQVTPFIGRESELAEIGSKLQEPDCQLLTLLGPGGSGKTRLTIESAKTQLSNYQHGVFFVNLAPLQEVDKIPSAIAQALNFSLYGQREPKEQLLDYLRDQEMLLILDNFEHLLDGVDFVNDILLSAPDIKILVTTRTSLMMMGEHIYPVWGMAFPEAVDKKVTIDRYSALQLFESVAGRRQPTFKLEAENIPDVIRICALVEGMPLGIILAASWVPLLSPAEIAAEIARDLAFLETEMRDLPPRQCSMRSVFNQSWRLLSEKEREVMAALSVFRGGFTREAARDIAGASTRELMGLTDKTMLSCTPRGRFEVHELLRQYAAEKLAAAGLERKYQDRHLIYFREWGEQAEENLVGPDQIVWLKLLERELDNIRAALGWARETDIQSGLQLSASLRQLWTHNYVLEGEAWLSGFLDQAQQVKPAIRAKALWAQARINMLYLLNFNRARGQVEQSAALYRELGDQQGISRCLFVLGWGAETNDLMLESLAIFREIGDKLGIAEVLRWLSDSHNPEQSLAYLEESESIYRELDHLAGIADVQSAKGGVAFRQGDFETARLLWEESLALRESVGLKRGRWILSSLGNLHFWQGDFPRALEYFEKSISVSQQAGDKHAYLWTLSFQGYAYLRMGDYDRACANFTQCQQQFKKNNIVDGVAFSTEGLASLALIQGQAGKTARLFGWADAARDSIQNTRPSLEQADIDQQINTIIEMIGEEAYVGAYAEGQAMTMEQAIAYSIGGE